MQTQSGPAAAKSPEGAGIDALMGQGAAWFEKRAYDRALTCFVQVITQQPQHVDALANCGGVLAQQGRYEEAREHFARALSIDPDHLGSLAYLGAVLIKLGQRTGAAEPMHSAVAQFDRALQLSPHHPGLLNNRGFALAGLQRHDEALDSYRQALAIDPGHLEGLRNCGVSLNSLGRYEEARLCFERILQRDPKHADALANLGIALGGLDLCRESLDCFDRVLALQPRFVYALLNRGVLLDRLARFEEAMDCYEQVLRIDPQQADALCNRGLSLLGAGELAAGFRAYESRWRTAQFRAYHPPSAAAPWLGEAPLDGRSILLHCEQGYGDTLQFVRYAPLVARLGGRVVLQVQDALRSLIDVPAGVTQVVGVSEPLPPHDLRCSLLSLPLALGTTLDTIPRQVPYLSADPFRVRQWRARLGPRTRARIGLVWAGNQAFGSKRLRDLSLQTLRPLLQLDAEFHSLQKEIPPQDRAALRDVPQLLCHGEALQDFADTAALLDHLDLLITVDTAAAHLAGALGKPVWIMNRYAACWRWLRGRADSPWYPSARLFRQSAFGDWAGVVREVGEAAAEFLGRHCEAGSIVSAGVAVGVPAPAIVATAAADAVALMRQGAEALGRGEQEQALTRFTQALAVDPANVAALINRGSVLAGLGRYEEALECFMGVPVTHPHHAEALSNRGYVLRLLNRHAQALKCVDQALRLAPQNPAALCNRGFALIGLERGDEAIACFRELLALQPGHREALGGMAYALAGQERHEEALDAVEGYLALDPLHPDVLNTGGYAAIALGRHQQALHFLERALGVAPAHLGALTNCGLALSGLQRHQEAVVVLERALAIDPLHVPALDNCGAALNKLERHEEALACFDRALGADPFNINVLNNRAVAAGSLDLHVQALADAERVLSLDPRNRAGLNIRGFSLLSLNRHAEALACLDEVLALDPADLDALVYRSIALAQLYRPQEALDGIEQALAIDPGHVGALRHKGVVLDWLNRREEALVCFDRALEADPHCANSLYNRSLVYLALGRLREGFRDMEQRWNTPLLKPYRLATAAPLWLGRESLCGRTILLHFEQGLGDTLHFARYAPLVAERGARVVLRVPAALRSLMATLPASPELICDNDPLPPHDFHCPLMSLPLALGTEPETIPARIPYLRADVTRVSAWNARLGNPDKPFVGIVWAGRQLPPVNHRRDMTLQLLLPLLRLDAHFVSLQKDIPPGDRAVLQSLPDLFRYGESLGDFADTAALIANLDLVITVDTAVAHLAGALGKPVWIMQRYAADWRWLQQRADSPWYPTARLFRQRALGHWGSVVEQIVAAAREGWPSRS